MAECKQQELDEHPEHPPRCPAVHSGERKTEAKAVAETVLNVVHMLPPSNPTSHARGQSHCALAKILAIMRDTESSLRHTLMALANLGTIRRQANTEAALIEFFDAQLLLCRHFTIYGVTPAVSNRVWAQFSSVPALEPFASLFSPDSQSSLIHSIQTLLQECVGGAIDPLIIADSRMALATLWQKVGWQGSPSDLLAPALDAYKAAGDLYGQADCNRLLSTMEWNKAMLCTPPATKPLAVALEGCKRAADLFEACNMPAAAANCLRTLASYHAELAALHSGAVQVIDVTEDSDVSMEDNNSSVIDPCVLSAQTAIVFATRAREMYSRFDRDHGEAACVKVLGEAHDLLSCCESLPLADRQHHFVQGVSLLRDSFDMMRVQAEAGKGTVHTLRVAIRSSVRLCEAILGKGKWRFGPEQPAQSSGLQVEIADSERLEILRRVDVASNFCDSLPLAEKEQFVRMLDRVKVRLLTSKV
eukprot:c16408_g1_i2.p1 GENE.c16408_g1_i2~~c16408_g1_i2.p1  ORF type:complete len:475 (+),score=94.86 c16408_g1_i2:367-1791(+)